MWSRQRNQSRQTRIAAVLDVGSHKMCCLIARLLPPAASADGAPRSAQAQLLGYAYVQSEGVSGGYVTDMDSAERAMRQAIAKAEQMADVAVDRIYVTASGGHAGSDSLTARIFLRDGLAGETDIASAVEAARSHGARRGKVPVHTRAIGFRLDGAGGVRDPRGMVGQRLEADMHSVLVDPLVLRNIALCLRRCHIEMAGFAAPAYVSGLCTLASSELLGGGGVIDMGAGVTSVAIFANGRMIFSGAVKRGGQQITRDLAKVFSLTLGEAERLKTLYGCVFCEAGDENGVIVLPTTTNGADERWLSLPRPEVAAIIRRRLEDVFEAIASLLDQAGFRRRDALNFVLTGGGSQLIGADALAERVLEGQVRLGAPPPLFGGPSPEIGPAFSAAVGLLTFLHEEDWAFAFSPRAARPASYLARVGEWLRHSF